MAQQNSFASDRGQIGINATLSLSMLLASLGTSIANIALPALAQSFSAPFSHVQAVVVAYLGALTIAVVLAGRLGDRYGLKPMLLTGLGLFLGGSLLCAAAPTLTTLIGARAIQGVGAAFLMTLSMALMRQTAGEARMGRAMGLLGTVSALGTALGPSLGGLLIPTLGWRGIFWLQVPFAAIALILAFAVLPNDQGRGWTHAPRLRVVLNRSIASNLVVNVLVAAVMMATLVVGPFYLGLGLGLTAELVGLVMAIGPLIAIFSGVPSGQLVDTLGSDRMLAVGLALLAGGAFLLALLPNMIGISGYVLSMVILTPGYQLFQAANNTAALTGVPKTHYGTVSGLLSLSRNIGLVAGAAVMGAVFAYGVGAETLVHAAPAAIAGGMRLTFLSAVGMMIVAIGVVFRQRVRFAS